MNLPPLRPAVARGIGRQGKLGVWASFINFIYKGCEEYCTGEYDAYTSEYDKCVQYCQCVYLYDGDVVSCWFDTFTG